MTYKDIPRLLTMTIVWLLLLAWYLNASRAGCVVAVILLALVALILFVSGAEIALTKRRIFLNECVEPHAPLLRLMRRRYLLVGVAFVKSAVLAVILLVGVLNLAERRWSLMFADVLLLSLLLPRFYGALAGQLREDYRYVTARRWAIWVSTLFLWLESLIVLVFADGHDYVGLRWQEVIAYGATTTEVLCQPIASLAALLSSIDALGLWAAQNLSRSLADLPQTLMAAFSLLVSAGLSFVFAYAYSRALVGMVGRPWTMWPIAPSQTH
jgi:hypothetical protein